MGRLAVEAQQDDVGDLGFTLKDRDPAAEPEDLEMEVAFVRPDGPAAGSGLAVGDVIETVDGHSVLGSDSLRFATLTRGPAGTKLSLGIRGGKSVELVLGPPLR